MDRSLRRRSSDTLWQVGRLLRYAWSRRNYLIRLRRRHPLLILHERQSLRHRTPFHGRGSFAIGGVQYLHYITIYRYQ